MVCVVLLGQRPFEGGVALQSVVEISQQEEVVHLGLKVGSAHAKLQPCKQLAQVLVTSREVVGVGLDARETRMLKRRGNRRLGRRHEDRLQCCPAGRKRP